MGYSKVVDGACVCRDAAASRERCGWCLAETAPILRGEAPEVGKTEPCGDVSGRRVGSRCQQRLARRGKTHTAKMRERRMTDEGNEMAMQRAFWHVAEAGKVRHGQRVRQRPAHIRQRTPDIARDRSTRGRSGERTGAIWHHGMLQAAAPPGVPSWTLGHTAA
ncbi:hypothetical protein Rmf_08620 [Roseomonas fluvialis]|uniref:Uncharacterized protein n=1 Tax=Roseomonas fluvialis TaxID=1750527 RepID=A0ABM7XZK3_9PROT|nr:hypothetical protein Rmf_08620 [Roseomonas fluvialis]